MHFNFDHPNETTYYQQYSTLHGQHESIAIGRRNGVDVPLFSPHQFGLETEYRHDMVRLLREVMYGLTRTERRTWLLILLGNSILAISESERVTPAAIYERIRGNSKGQGGMVAKNDYVSIWWKRRQGRRGQ